MPSLKEALLQAVIAELRAELMHLREATKAAQEAATGEESRPENQYDTRALEASYLAAAQGKRAAEIERMISVLQGFPADVGAGKAGSGSLLELSSERRRTWYFLLPFGAGVSAEAEGQKAIVVTLDSPLGQALQGKKAGDLVEFRRPSGAKEYEILQVL